MSDDLSDFWVHTVTVESLLGPGSNGDTYATQQQVVGFLDGSRKLVRSSTGEQVVSESTFYCPKQYASLFTPSSKVATSDGAVSLVIRVNVNDAGNLGLPDHCAVSLT